MRLTITVPDRDLTQFYKGRQFFWQDNDTYASTEAVVERVIRTGIPDCNIIFINEKQFGEQDTL